MPIDLYTLAGWLSDIKAEKAKRLADGVSLVERRYNVYAAVSFVLLMSVVGLPQWWRTTAVYRAPLPYGEIAELPKAILTLPVSASIVAGDESVDRILREDKVASDVESRVGKEFHRLKVALALTQRSSSEIEQPLLSSEFGSFQELESALYVASVAARGKKIHSQDLKGDGVEIFVLHRPREERLRMHFGSSSRIFVVGDFLGELRNGLAEILANVILHGYLRVDELLEPVARHTKEEIKLISDAPKRNLSTGVLSPKMTLELHVVDPQPVPCSQRFTIDRIVDDRTVKGFLSALRDVTDVSVKSQMLYKIDFAQGAIRRRGKDSTWFLEPNSLQHIINPIETYLGTDVTTEPVYHMLLYIAPPAIRPLFVSSPDQPSNPAAKKTSAPYNSFVVSGWGSVAIVNANRTCVDKEKLVVDSASIKATKMALVANLRKFFGFQLPKEFERTPSASLADWEVQSLRYRALVEYVFSSIRTLSSLTKLLGEITTIVINDEVAASIATAVSEINNILNATSGGAGGHWRVHSMLKSATRAFEESEKAFFDPSLLALLYFPEDQKYAIYIPLFLPIGVPVAGSIVFIWRHIRESLGKDGKDKKL